MVTQAVTGPQWKADQIVTLGLFRFIATANSYTHALPTHSVITSHSYSWPAFLEQILPDAIEL